MTKGLRGRRALSIAPVLAAALTLPGCGGGGYNPVTGSSQPQRTVIGDRSWALQPLETLAVDVKITGAGNGTLDATVEWTFATNDVDIYVTATACTLEMFSAELCGYKAKADSTTSKPERLSFSVASGDSYRFWIVNFGPQAESGTFNAGLTQ
jgi:hypothetical protein